MTTEHELQDQCERLVRNEINLCVSSLVATLARGAGMATGKGAGLDLENLTDQAQELCAPVLDYEEAARQTGVEFLERQHGWIVNVKGLRRHTYKSIDEAARAICEADNIDPYEWEVFEHWAVSDWLAQKLEAHGERIDRDFAGLTIWGRTTTGQSIAMDSVIREIAREVLKAGDGEAMEVGREVERSSR